MLRVHQHIISEFRFSISRLFVNQYLLSTDTPQKKVPLYNYIWIASGSTFSNGSFYQTQFMYNI